MENDQNKSIFEGFTNLYSVTKTLRFELVPYPVTESRLPAIIPNDEKRAEFYKSQMKPMLDDLHNQFISESMKVVNFDNNKLVELQDVYRLLKSKNATSKSRRENETEIRKLEAQLASLKEFLRKQVVASFKTCAEIWKEKYPKLKQNDHKILTEAGVIEILKDKNADDTQKLEALKMFERFWTYFSGFNQNRLNYYVAESKATGIANRAIDENLIKYLENIQLFEKLPQNEKLDNYKDYFKIENYNNCLNQSGITEFNEKIIAKVNSIINQINQQNNQKYSTLKILYKQIGSEKAGFEMFEIENNKEWESLEELFNNQNRDEKNGEFANISTINDLFKEFFKEIEPYNLEKVYFNKASINTISNRWMKSWESLGKLLKESKIGNIKYTGGEYKIPKLISLSDLKQLLDNLDHVQVDVDGEKGSLLFKGGQNGVYKNNSLIVESAWQTLLNIWKFEIDKNFELIKNAENDFFKAKSQKYEKNDQSTKIIKSLCDAYLSFQQIIKLNIIKSEGLEFDDKFYNKIDIFLNSQNNELDKYYNAFRNHLSKKAYSIDKIKLNFDNATLLAGFDLNKESDNTSIILRKDGRYELVILSQKGKNIFDKKKNNYPNLFVDDGSGLEKMQYKLLPGPNKMLPKVAFSQKNIKTFDPSEEVLRVYESGSFKKGDSFNKDDLIILIDFWKKVLSTHNEWKNFGMQFAPSVNYQGIDKFYTEVAKQGYRVNFDTKINESELSRLELEQGLIYRFKIHNKDFQEFAKGSKNLHTIYFENLFTSNNLQNPNGIGLKLNGKGEIFRRPASLTGKQVVQKNNLTKGQNDQKVIENERFTKDKYFFHFPVTINFCSQGLSSVSQFNEKVCHQMAKNSDEVNFIGIDRGEKHLLYYSVINSKGHIIEQNSLNKIETEKPIDEKEVKFEYINGEYKNVELVSTGKKVHYCDYHTLLDYYEKKRLESRQSWKEIGKIKDLKKGYLSQVINKIYSLMIKHNAVVVMEDLTTGVTNRTSKVEKAVYKAFEHDLAKKLNHLILKNSEVGGGSVLEGYQLTPPLGAGDMGIFERSKQWGSLFYVSPDYTSAIDPITGWRKKKYFKNTDSIEKIRELFNPDTGVEVRFDTAKKCFSFSYNNEDLDKRWELFAYQGLRRFNWNPKERKSEEKDLYKEFDQLFLEITGRSNALNDEMLNNPSFNWKKLIILWNLLNQIRNTDKNKSGNGNDFIQSPVWSDKIGGFYDSRKVDKIGKNGENSSYPLNGDANGAYNIARKGLILLERFKSTEGRPDLYISRSDWDGFVTKVNKNI